MGVIYDDSAIIPGPLVQFNKQIEVAGDGTKLGVLYTGTITGKLVAYKGSPRTANSGGSGWGGPFNRFWQTSGYPDDESVVIESRLKSIENKQEALRALFATDGKWLEWQSQDGSAPLKCQPRIKGVHFAEGQWAQTCDYTIDFEMDYLYLNGNPEVDTPFHNELISTASESWQVENADVAKTFHLTHTATAVGKRQFDNTGGAVGLPWQHAKDFIQNRLELGYDTFSNFSPITGHGIVASSLLNTGSVLDLNAFQAYNFVRSETVDELAGSYTVNESWTLATASSGTDVYNISVKKFSQDPNTTTNLSIQGTIKGFYANLNDFDSRFLNAEYVWTTLQGAPLYNRVSSYVSGISLNSQPLVGAVDYNPLEGTITYNYEFSDKLFNGDTFEEYTISKSSNITDYKYTVDIQGKIMGRRYESDLSPNDKFNRALTLWNNTINVSPFLYNRIITSQYFPEIVDLRRNPTSVKVDMDQPNGMISYTLEFNNRKNDNDINDEDVHEEYNLSSSFSREDGKVTYTITGTIEGLSIVSGSGAREAKYNVANIYWSSVAASSLVSRTQNYFNITLSNSNPIETEVAKNPTLGTINYTYKYTNEPAPYVVGAFSEVITIQGLNDNADVNVHSNIPVLGRAAGPVLQDMGTTPERTRSIEIEAVFAPAPGGNLIGDYALRPNYDTIVAQIKPTSTQVFKTEDSNTWVPRNGRYSRSVRWIYQ